MKSPAVFSALKAQKNTRKKDQHISPESEITDQVRWSAAKTAWAKLKQSFSFRRGRSSSAPSQQGELTHES
ncbi:MAG: hypothetical protein AAGD96_19625 [Chloroflexota bacterium]